MIYKNERFIIEYGRFGAYFYDLELNNDVDLPEIKSKLNAYDKLHKRQNKHIKKFLEKILAFNYALPTEPQIIAIREWLEGKLID